MDGTSKNMASAFGHAAAAWALSKVHPKKIMTRKILVLGIISSIIPDIDVLCFKFGISDDHILGHRGITHSLVFGLVWAIILTTLFHRKESHKYLICCYYAIATISHGLLDALTNGGAGVAFFYPFTDERYFLPWRVIQVSPLGAADFFSEWGIQVLLNEAMFIGAMSFLVYVIGMWLNKKVYR